MIQDLAIAIIKSTARWSDLMKHFARSGYIRKALMSLRAEKIHKVLRERIPYSLRRKDVFSKTVALVVIGTRNRVNYEL
jgi:hypothetical protein